MMRRDQRSQRLVRGACALGLVVITAVLAPACGSDGPVGEGAAAIGADDGGTGEGGASEAGSAGADAGSPSADAASGGDASGNPDAAMSTTACGTDPDCIVFVTYDVYRGDMGGSTPDAICMKASGPANGGGRLSGRLFKAWLSDATGSAATRLTHSTKPYVRADGVVIAANWAAFAATTHAAPINYSERGMPMDPDTGPGIIGEVWTATMTNGTGPAKPVGGGPAGPNDCTNWTSKTFNADWIALGQWAFADSRWSDQGGGAGGGGECLDNGHLYCVQQ